MFKKWNIVPYNSGVTALSSSMASVLCSPLLLGGIFCKMGSFASMLDNSSNNGDRYALAMANVPAGAGWRNFMHYGQLVRTSGPTFRRYDYESASANRNHYGVDTPPDYDLSLIDFPLAIMSGSLDDLASPRDVAWTA